MNYNNLPNSYKCTGCAACENICPVSAIDMILDTDGFYRPKANAEKCTSCGLCEKTCPVLHPKYENSANPDCYALMAQDELRFRSSSGGAFGILAGIILERNGVVCGAAYSDDFKTVKHIIITDNSELYKLQGSKYIMSNVGGIYAEVKKYLHEGRYVLFSGTPCQVAGLNSYLGKEATSERLLTVDLICHGIPSVKAFHNYMRDVHGNRKITHLGFKDKEYGWHASMTIGFDNNEVYNMPCERDDYFRSYLNGLNKNHICGECPFAQIPRQGDITIGDYWGINNVNPDYNDKKGTSVVLMNNEKALLLAEEIKGKVKLFEKTELQGAVNGNLNLVSSPSIHKSRNQFFKKIDSRRYHDLVTWGFASPRYDIGIVGIPIFPNFGGTLTYYSLYRSLKDMGYTVALFSRPRSTGRPPVNPDEIYNVNPFEKNDLKLDFKDKNQMGQFANDTCESFVVGSDQLFNSDLYKSFGEIVTLDWVSDNHRKAAYAASFGHNFFWGPENERAKMAHYMQKFDAFSVREEDGVELARRSFGVDAKWVLDPVFLCDPKHYYNIAKSGLSKESIPHIFEYILDPSEDKEKILSFAEQALELSGELYSEMQYFPTEKTLADAQSRFSHKLLQGKVDDRLYSLINSDFVIADSFHGVCFAIIFNKPFIAILNPLRGATRFYTILGKLNLLDRMVTGYDELSEKKYLLTEPCDFAEANIILAKERERCLKWLKEAVDPEGAEKKAFSTDDITDLKLRRIDNAMRINALKSNAALSDRKYHLCRNIYDYLDKILSEIRSLTVLISVKDTPGFALNSRINKKLAKLGLKTSLVDKHWHSYVAVIDSGRVINEVISKKDERVAYVGKLSCGDVKVVSRSFNAGNIAYIGVNGVDYSENKRGINIVIYDKTIGEVIDSVSFDTHDEKLPYFRFGKRFAAVLPAVLKNEIVGDIKYSVVPPESFSKDELDAFYCCRLAVEKGAGRKFVLWEDSKLFRDTLKEYFDIDVAFVVTLVKTKVNGDTIREILEIKDKKSEYYVIIPTIKYKSTDEAMFTRLGFGYVEDYLYRYIKPIIISDRDYENEPYYDVFMNSITGNYSAHTKIVLTGYNINLSLGKNILFRGDSSLSINCSSNSFLSIGDNIAFNGENKIVMFDDFSSVMKLGNNLVINDTQFWLYAQAADTEMIIGDRTTTNTNDRFSCLGGRRLIIGEDVMFSVNIRILSGDGHSLFDVKTGKNTNSIPEILSPQRKKVVIGDHTWVGMNVTMLAGTNIGSGSVIGANSLVKGVFPNNCAIGGNPAKLLKKDVAWCRRNCCADISMCGDEYVHFSYDITDLSGKEILVLGGTKFMGIRLVEHLLDKNCHVTIANRGTHKDKFGNKVERIIIDRKDEADIHSAFAGKQYDVVFDISTYFAEHIRYTLTNIKCAKYILISSAAVYDNYKNITIRTENLVNPYYTNILTEGIGTYKVEKLNSEIILCKEFRNVNSAVVRVPAVLDEEVLGYDELTDRLYFYVEHIVKGIAFSEHNLDRPCTFVRTTDEADFLVFLAQTPYTGVYNIASSGVITMREIIDYIEKKTGQKANMQVEAEKNHFPFGGYEFDLSKTKSIGYNPTMLSDWIYNLLNKYIEQIRGEINL